MLTTSQRSPRCVSSSFRTHSTSARIASRSPPPPPQSPTRPRRVQLFPPVKRLIPSSTRIFDGVKSLEGKERAIQKGSLSLGGSRLRGSVDQDPVDESTVDKSLSSVEHELKDSPLLDGLGLDSSSYQKRFFGYRQAVLDVFRKDYNGRGQKRREPGDAAFKSTYSKETLQQIYKDGGPKSLESALKYGFYGHVASSKFSISDLSHQKELADLRYPSEWFPATRTMHRTVHLHVGPTNSGKTYHALKRLEAAESGVYAGPLRLLAHEVYTRLNAKGKRCLLITGEERRSPDETMSGNLSSCTVEMVPLNRTCDVAVIDEIQMMGSRDRGWAWTQAFLGLKAKELHVCGEERSIPLVRELAASVGDKLEIHRYERLSPLQVMDNSLSGRLRKLEKGDCVVSFSVMAIHALRQAIEKQTGRKVAIVYGSLPPETRAQQARLFNDPNNEYDILVASDAIGMGLNLSIKRIIFETTSKRQPGGRGHAPLSVAEIKQIAGRAGRYRTAEQDLQDKRPNSEPVNAHMDAQAKSEGQSQKEVAPVDVSLTSQAPQKPPSSNTGYVTTLERFDFPFLWDCMHTDPEPITSAGLFPPGPIVERFARYFPPGTPFSYILLRLHETVKLHTRFHLCELRDQLVIADAIQPAKGLTTMDRIIFCAAPASFRQGDTSQMKLFRTMAECVAQQQGGGLLDIKEMPLDVLDEEPSASRIYLEKLERLHKGIVLYLWLGYRFSGVFNTQALAMHVKGLVEAAIEKTLAAFSFDLETRRKIRKEREKKLLRQLTSNFPSRSAETAEVEVAESATMSKNHEPQLESDELSPRLDYETAEEPATSYDPEFYPEANRSPQPDAETTINSFAEWRAAQRQDGAQASDSDLDTNTRGKPVTWEEEEVSEGLTESNTDPNYEPHDPELIGGLDDDLNGLHQSLPSNSGPREQQATLPASDIDSIRIPSDPTDKDPHEVVGILDHEEYDRAPTHSHVGSK